MIFFKIGIMIFEKWLVPRFEQAFATWSGMASRNRFSFASGLRLPIPLDFLTKKFPAMVCPLPPMTAGAKTAHC